MVVKIDYLKNKAHTRVVDLVLVLNLFSLIKVRFLLCWCHGVPSFAQTNTDVRVV